MLLAEPADFGSCQVKIDNRKVELPIAARTYLYMEQSYSRYRMSKSQRQLMAVWDKQFPVSAWECKHAERIEKLQGNVNNVLKTRCH